MSIVLIVIGAFCLAFIFLIGIAIFFVKHDYDTMYEEQYGQNEKSKVTVDKDGIAWGDVRP